MMILGINHITLGIKELERSFYFYREVLGLKPLCKWKKGAYFLAGKDWVCLNVDSDPATSPSATHYAFTVAAEQFEEMKERILASGAKVYKDNTSPGDSLYFLDPDSHQLEIHVGNWKSRLEVKRKTLGSWTQVEWFV